MEQRIYSPKKGRGAVYKQIDTQPVTLTITGATFIAGKKILVNFSDGRSKMVDFAPLFNKYVKGAFEVYHEPSSFKKFIVKDGNLFWGKNEDVIFPVQTLYNSRYSKLVEEEILYVL